MSMEGQTPITKSPVSNSLRYFE